MENKKSSRVKRESCRILADFMNGKLVVTKSVDRPRIPPALEIDIKQTRPLKKSAYDMLAVLCF